ncbi:MAG: sigma-70 family RNA polymerase sigma factor [Acidimicrobiia bacterium]
MSSPRRDAPGSDAADLVEDARPVPIARTLRLGVAEGDLVRPPAEPDSPTASFASPSEVPSWEEVARDHGRLLYEVAYRLTGDQDDARDLVQESLLRVGRGLENYRPGSLEAWLSRIVTNVFLDEVRRRRRRPLPTSGPISDAVLARLAGPEEPELGLPGDIQQALISLPVEFRAAIVLCDVAGLAYDQIARVLGVPPGTVRSRVHRGRRLLREALG